MLWDELSSKEFDKWTQKSEHVCILPIGAIEKHGDQLPLGTDMYIVTGIANAAAAASPTVVFPYYFFGQISEAKHIKGTLAPSHKLIMDALLEMCDEIHRNGFNKILLLSGHGGNNYFLPFFAQMFPGIDRPYAIYTYFVHHLTDKQLKAIQTETGVEDMGNHAGFSETALMMHLRPDLVHLEKADISESVGLKRLYDTGKLGIFTGFDWYADYPHHFAGDPSSATKEYGELLFNILRDNVINVLYEIKKDETSPALIKEYNGLVYTMPMTRRT